MSWFVLTVAKEEKHTVIAPKVALTWEVFYIMNLTLSITDSSVI